MTHATPADLLARLDELGIAHRTYEHDAVFTVAQSASVKDTIPGAHSKNLFLKDRRGRPFLVVAKDDTAIDLKRLHEVIGACGRMSFGSAELLLDKLGVAPGSVTPFATLNDCAARVTVVLDAELMRRDLVNFHPLRNTMTTAISSRDLVRFLQATGHEPLTVTLPAPANRNCMASGPPPS